MSMENIVASGVICFHSEEGFSKEEALDRAGEVVSRVAYGSSGSVELDGDWEHIMREYGGKDIEQIVSRFDCLIDDFELVCEFRVNRPPYESLWSPNVEVDKLSRADFEVVYDIAFEGDGSYELFKSDLEDVFRSREFVVEDELGGLIAQSVGDVETFTWDKLPEYLVDKNSIDVGSVEDVLDEE